MVTDSPIVGTGMEYKAAVDSGVVIVAKNPGTVETVTSDQIVIRREDGTKDTYHLIKFKAFQSGNVRKSAPDRRCRRERR